MINFSPIAQYRENNHIEAKKALSGLHRSIWETYSAFANTCGGIFIGHWQIAWSMRIIMGGKVL